MKKLIWVGLFCLLAAGASYFYLHDDKKVDSVYIEIHPSYEDIQVSILATGTVQPENRLEIKPPVAGRIEKVYVVEGQMVHRGQTLALMSSSERAALLDSARASGPDELAKWEELYKPTPILAPITGTIISRNVEPGQSFTTTDAVLLMSDRLTVKAQVDETDISAIQVGQKASIVLDAYPNQNIEAKVDKIAYDAKTVNSVTTYIVDVLPIQTPPFMKSGMTANVSFFIKTLQHVLSLPTGAVKTKDGKSKVRIPGKGELFKEVQIGATDGKKIEISSGLAESDIVLVPDLKSVLKAPDASTNPFGGPPGLKKK